MFFEKQIHTQRREKGVLTQNTPQIHSKTIVTFKGGRDKLYYTQHSLNKTCYKEMGEYIFFFFNILGYFKISQPIMVIFFKRIHFNNIFSQYYNLNLFITLHFSYIYIYIYIFCCC